ncbi:MAG: hypothetical protein HYY25_01125 [Candidatus Wallbacteria bacterium]|nr:hypothetical protein [Candidatus Wallbacteria bacterium]
MTAVALDSSELPRLLDALPSSLAAPDVVEDIHERHGLFEAISSAGDWRRDSLLRQLGANSEATIERVAEAPTTYLDQKVYLEGQIHKFDGEDSFFLRRGQALVRVRGVPTEFVSRIATALRGVAHQMRYQSEVNRMTGTRSGAQLALEGVKVLSDDVEAMRYVHVLGTLTGSARVKMSLGDIVELPEITAEFVAQDVAAH